ncbi:MAG TPA: DUF6489 family protein [Beijerinckiaceae bacterium]|nr:DUF6489 family protein [Beijerinckiaceae bacterium]
MKVTIDIDCTPQEARAFIGLPDVEPMQKAVMGEIERRMMSEIENFGPEHMMKTWVPMLMQGASWLPEFFQQAMKTATGGSAKK